MSGVEIRVSSNSTAARADLSRLENSVKNIEATATNTTKAFKALALGITAAFTGNAFVKSMSSASDSITNLENKMSLVVGKGKELSRTMESVRQIAGAARQPVSTAAETFNKFGLALKDSSVSANQLLLATQAVLQSATLSGASSTSAEAAIVQLGQGLASGTLRGEELNSVLEQVPRLAQAIAKGMGVPFGELRALAKDGKVTTTAVLNAILDQAETIQNEFLTLGATVEGLNTVLKDEFTQSLAALDKEFGFSTRLKKAILVATSALDYFGNNLYVWVGLAKARLTLLEVEFFFFKEGIKNILKDIFSGNISIEDLKQNFSSKISEIKEFASKKFEDIKSAITIKIEPLDLTGYIPSMNSVLNEIGAFTESVIGFFRDAYMAISGNSFWWEIFSEGENRIGGPKLIGALNFVSRKLSEWKTVIIGKFESLAVDATAAWNRFIKFLSGTEIDLPNGETFFKKNSVSLFIDDLISKSAELKTALTDAITSSFALSKKEVVFRYGSDGKDAITVENPTLLGKVVDVFSNGMKDLSINFDERAQSVIDKLYDVWSSGTIQLAMKENPVVSSVLSFGSGAKEAYDNGKLVTQGFIDGIIANKELLGTIIAGAFIGSVKYGTIPVLLTATGLILGPDALASDSFKATANSFGAALGQALKVFFSGKDTGASIVNSLSEGLAAIGKGIADELFGTDRFQSSMTDALMGALVVLTLGFTFSSTVRGGILSIGNSFAKELFGTSVVKAFTTGLSDALFKSMLAAETSERVLTASKALGNTMGKTIRNSIILGLGVGIASEIGGWLDNSLREVNRAADRRVNNKTVAQQSQERAQAVFNNSQGDGGVSAIIDGITTAGIEQTSAQDLTNLSLSEIQTLLDKANTYQVTLLDKIGNLGGLLGDNSKDATIRVLTEALALKASGVDPTRKASGGYISGPGGPKEDKVPALLSNGEFVIQASAVDKLGLKTLSMINKGIIPQSQRFANGTPTPFDATIAELESKAFALAQYRGGDTRGMLAAVNASIIDLKSRRAAYDTLVSAGVDTALAESVSNEKGKKEKEAKDKLKAYIQSQVDGFQADFKSSLSSALKSGSPKDFFKGVLDSFTSRIIDTFTEGVTNSIFKGLNLEKGLTNFFGGMVSFGSDLGAKSAGAIKDGISNYKDGSGAGGGGFASILSGISSVFGGLMKGIGSIFSGIFGGGGAGGLFSLFSGGSLLGFASGGIVPTTSYSQAGKDSVPAMLTPGEMIIPANKVKDFNSNNSSGGSQQVFNISVTGNVDAETKRNIIKMLPEITRGVNTQNRSNNYR
jgi:tape measure domain-containing protein